LVILVVTTLSNLILFVWGRPPSPLFPPFGTFVGPVGFFAVFLFASYESLSIRRALAVRLYRNQSLGIGLMALSWVLLFAVQFSIVHFLPPNSPGPFGTPIDFPFDRFTWLVLFYWVDTSIRAARRSDPLLRDTLRWSQVRIVVWVLLLGSIVVNSLVVGYQVVVTGLSIFAQVDLPLPFLSNLPFLTFVVPAISGAVYLPLTVFRSRDPTLRRHLAWFGIFVLLLLGILFSFNLPRLSREIENLVASDSIIVGGYFLYRSARSLAPLHRISSEDLNQQTGLETTVRPDARMSGVPRRTTRLSFESYEMGMAVSGDGG
jgi:hypothetical protein